MNRRDTEPFVRWCERTAGAIPPPTRYESMLSRFRRTSVFSVSFGYQGLLEGTTEENVLLLGGMGARPLKFWQRIVRMRLYHRFN